VTKIEWAHAGLGRGKTWNPIRAQAVVRIESSDPGDLREATAIGWHCEKVSPACANCYAERQILAGARGGTKLPYKPAYRANGDVRVYLDERTLLAPLSWKQPTGIFVCSMTDAFGDWVQNHALDRMLAIAMMRPQHIFIFLTKRGARQRRYFESMDDSGAFEFHSVVERVQALVADYARLGRFQPLGFGPVYPEDYERAKPMLRPFPLANVWFGVTAEDQHRADERRDDLRALAEAGWTTFVSYGPALGPVDWTGWEFVRQIIFEGETGPHARPSHPQWARDTRDFCAAHGVAYFHKQWGEWKPISEMPASEYDQFYRSNRIARPGEDQEFLDDIYGRRCTIPTDAIGYTGLRGDAAFQVVDGKGGMTMFRVGRARSGRTLDGAEHNAFPEPRA
jgi:protein gp37